MATELLNRTAIRWFNEHSLVFKEERDDLLTIRVPLPDDAGMLEISILDHEFDRGIGLLEIQATDFVRFTSASSDRALAMCNFFNARQVGKFCIDNFRDVTFSLDCPLAESAGPSEFGSHFILGLSSLSRCYPVAMRVRWGNLTIEEALAEEEDGEIPSRLLSDEEIAELMAATGDREQEERGEEGSGECADSEEQ